MAEELAPAVIVLGPHKPVSVRRRAAFGRAFSDLRDGRDRGRRVDESRVGSSGEGDREGLLYGQRSPKLNVIASKGRMLTASSSFAHPMSTHSPSRSSNASNVRSVGSMSHR